MTDVGDYLAELPGPERDALERVREIVRRVAPESEEGTSYGMPAFRWGGKPLLGFRASAKHLAVYPFSPAVVEAVAGRLGGFSLAKGTIRFTPEQPLPEDVVEEIVMLRMREIA